MDALAQDVTRMWERLDGDRGTWKSHWQDVTNYSLPDRADYVTTRAPGAKRGQYVFDSTPVWATEQAASGLHSLLTSTTLQWFYLRTDQEALNNDQTCVAWLDDTAARMYTIFNGSKHNFASQSHELYLDLVSIGTAVMGALESPRSDILFTTRHMRECCVQENEEDRVDTLVRRWQYTAKQAVEAWGNGAGEAAVKAFGTKPDTKFWYLHRVMPRRDRDPQRADARHKPFQSVYVCEADQTVIGEGGFNEFPYMVPRFSKATGELYGRGPGMTALFDVKMLNEMVKLVIKAAQKVVDPPLQLPDDGFMLPIKTVPGSMNFYRAGTNGRIEPLETKGNIPLGIEMLKDLRQRIIRTYFVEWMLMPSDPTDPAAAGKGVTATYVLQQRDEKMRLLSPMLARLQSEFLGPLIDRTFAIMWRQSLARRFGPGSLLAPPPPQLSGANLRVEYVSPIAVAQRSSQLDAIGRLVQTVLQLVQVDPRAAQTLDTEAIIRLTARDLNTPALALKTPEQLQQERQAEADAQAVMNQHAQMAALAKTAKDGTGAIENLAQAANTNGNAAEAA